MKSRWPLAFLALGFALLGSACAHRIGPELAPGYGGQAFDFSAPPCSPSPRCSSSPEPEPPECSGGASRRAGVPVDLQVDLQYLGTAGLYLEWQGHGVLFGPFFSRPSPLRVALGKMRPDPGAVKRGLAEVPMEKVGAILVGHAHYDHLLDIPLVAEEHAPGAQIYASGTARKLLFPYSTVYRRTVALDRRLGTWVRLRDAKGRALPVRVMPLATTHAPQSRFFRWAEGEARAPLHRPWEELRHWKLRQGQPLAFLVELLEGESEEVRFRLYYQDSASHQGTGLPPKVPGVGGVDLAVLCIASHHLARGFPEYLLEELEPRHVLVAHQEDFSRSAAKPTRFVPLLTRRRAESFLRQVSEAEPPAAGWQGPEGSVCGPSNETYSMALPGGWLRFRGHGAEVAEGPAGRDQTGEEEP
ncbi:MAG: hypothetical protein SX243_06970 [Acidobacteriota bacterium]|nr:hypothetical protein [Acidobacteriota bacterium]